MMETVEGRRCRFSLRALMLVVALCALLLAPCIWVGRQMESLRLERSRAMVAERRAQAEAARAHYLAQLQSAGASLLQEAATQPAHPATGTQGGLWAALSVNHPVFRKGETADLNLEFTLVNDGKAVLDPKLGDSRVLINGKELADSGLILSNGPRDARFEALPPGDHLRFGFALGDHFQEPGVYRVSWRGANFQSPEVVFRVLKAGGDPQP